MGPFLPSSFFFRVANATYHRGTAGSECSNWAKMPLIPWFKYCSNKLVFMSVIAGSCQCLWYIFRLLAHTLVRTRTVLQCSSDIFSSVWKWWLFTEWSIYIYHTVSLNFLKNRYATRTCIYEILQSSQNILRLLESTPTPLPVFPMF
jgi:hypothetical protein